MHIRMSTEKFTRVFEPFQRLAEKLPAQLTRSKHVAPLGSRLDVQMLSKSSRWTFREERTADVSRTLSLHFDVNTSRGERLQGVSNHFRERIHFDVIFRQECLQFYDCNTQLSQDTNELGPLPALAWVAL